MGPGGGRPSTCPRAAVTGPLFGSANRPVIAFRAAQRRKVAPPPQNMQQQMMDMAVAQSLLTMEAALDSEIERMENLKVRRVASPARERCARGP